MIGKEPTLIIYTVITVLNAVQTAAISMPAYVHTIIVVLTYALGAVVNRGAVTPNAKIGL